jgi:hypothetical protein
MTKALSDILGRLNGDMLALQGMEAKVSPPPPGPPATTAEQEAAAAPPAFKGKKEDYDHVKKLLEEIAGLAKSASEEIDKELKVPPQPGEPNPNTEAETKAAHSTSTKK